jgi:ABC-type spermidine/putrescine transport system permease subunit I
VSYPWRRARWLPATVVTGFVVAGLLLPLALIVVELGTGRERLADVVAGSLSATVRSVLLALAVPAVSLAPAVMIAAPLSRARPLVRLLGVALCGAPLVLNLLVVILAWMVVLEPAGLVGTVWARLGLPGDPPDLMFTHTASVLAMAYVVTPVMALVLLPSFRRIDSRTRESARLLGASPLTRFVVVELGYVAPAMLNALVIGYLSCLNVYLVPEYLTGPQLTTLGFLVQQDVITSFDLTGAGAQALILLVVALLPVSVALTVDRRLRRR